MFSRLLKGYLSAASPTFNSSFPSPDTSLKDGLFHEFKKHGKVTSVQIHGASEERYGLVFFRQQEDQEKALTVSKGKLFFGMLIEVTAWNGPGMNCRGMGDSNLCQCYFNATYI